MEFVQNVLMLQRGRKLLQRGQRELTYISRNHIFGIAGERIELKRRECFDPKSIIR